MRPRQNIELRFDLDPLSKFHMHTCIVLSPEYQSNFDWLRDLSTEMSSLGLQAGITEVTQC